jgi:phosphoglycolate phosphatase
VRAVLDLHDLHAHFVTIQCADDHPSKPHPSMVVTALAETGVAPEKAVILGDTVFDVSMGRAGGILALGVDWGYHDAADLLAAGAESVLGDFSELEPALARLFRW